jgi:hypothetical protein
MLAKLFCVHNFCQQCILAKHGRESFELMPFHLKLCKVVALNGLFNLQSIRSQSFLKCGQQLMGTVGAAQIANSFVHGQMREGFHADS